MGVEPSFGSPRGRDSLTAHIRIRSRRLDRRTQASAAGCRPLPRQSFRYGLDVADRFTKLWEQQAGASYHPWAEIVAIVDFLDGLREDPGADAFTTEEALARAVAGLGG